MTSYQVRVQHKMHGVDGVIIRDDTVVMASGVANVLPLDGESDLVIVITGSSDDDFVSDS